MRKKLFITILLFSLMSSLAYASGEIVQFADRVNYWNGEVHTVTITNIGNLSTSVNITIPTGFTYNGGNCTNPSASLIVCDLASSQSRVYMVNSSSSLAEYTVSVFTPVTNNSYTGNSVKIIRIKEDEIFHTLVEFGRGRGNYFFDSYGYTGGSASYAGTGHTGVGCAYVPNGTMFELSFLHKVNNVKQLFGDLSAEAYNASFSCTYPNSSVVRTHLISGVITNNTGTFIDYLIPTIEGSWERMGYISMDFAAGAYAVGGNFTINCTNMKYYLPIAGGNFVVNEDSFTLQARNREPFIASSYSTSIIGNGTQEVLITYNITNKELYQVDDVIIEIQAPPYATFIGTRGEIWGTALDQYRIEKMSLAPGESEIIQLVARFDTTTAPNLTTVDLTSGIKIKYVSCWELNAYNPNEYTQIIRNIGNGTVNMSIPSNITSVIERIIKIVNITTMINNTVTNINATVTNIQSIVTIINQTTKETNTIVKQINTTSYMLLNQSQILLNNTNIILNDTKFIADLLNCNGTNDSPICNQMNLINISLQNILNFTALINYTAHNLNITVIQVLNLSGVNVSVNMDLSDLINRLTTVKKSINCTNITNNNSLCVRISRIENNTLILNNTLTSIWNTTNYFNTTVFGNFTFIDIINAIDNVSVDTSDVLKAIQELEEFNEEVVFLITDSFGMQQSAKQDFLNGDVSSAMNQLSESNTKLQKAAALLVQEKNGLSAQQQSPAPFDASWVWVGMLTISAAALFLYLFGRSPPSKGGKASLGMIKWMIAVIVLLSCISFASANPGFGPLGTIVQEAASLNFGDQSKNQTVNVYYNCTGIRKFNISLPTGFSVTSTTAPCGLINPSLISCNFDDIIPGNNQGAYSVQATANFTDHTISTFTTKLSNYTNCNGNNISFIHINDNEIFYTLVEYGRGRGNYFYSTMDGKAGSGHTEVGCAYVPNGTLFELNFLHKMFNIKQYYDDPYAKAVNATFTCTYPNNTIVRSHLGTTIAQGANTTITYFIDEIGGSWERMGYLGMQFDPNENYVGKNLTISCYNISYMYPSQNGYIAVYPTGTTFNLQVRNPYPFIASSYSTSIIGNGTQEVLITYNITNKELYPVDDVIIEIQAPPYATFIGTRGELWGTALDQYRIEKMSLSPGQSEIITLVARFDTTTASNISSVNLSNSIKVKYVTCWDLNAYNPAESTQIIYGGGGSTTVNMSIPTTIIDIRERLEYIYNLSIMINSTTIAINNTVNNIQQVVSVINSTTIETNTIVKEINNTVISALGNVTVALNNTYSIMNYTSLITDLLNCNGTVDTPVCNSFSYVNSTINNITSYLVDINNTLNNITINLTFDFSGQNLSFNITPDLTNITIIIDDIMSELNCSMNWTTEPNASLCWSLARVENNTLMLNNSVTNINNLVNYFNTTVFGNVTLKQIYDKINNITVDTTSLIEEIRKARQFSQELVFLVTDAFGMQQAAKDDIAKGDLGGAAQKLREANAKLNQAADKLAEMNAQTQNELVTEPAGDFTWVLVAFTSLVLVAGLALYLFSKPAA